MKCRDELLACARILHTAVLRAESASPSPWEMTEEDVVRDAQSGIVADRSCADPADWDDLRYITMMEPESGMRLVAFFESFARRIPPHSVCSDRAVCVPDELMDLARYVTGRTGTDTVFRFAEPGCTCKPYTRHGGEPRWLERPGDTVDMISGWAVGKDCPLHGQGESTECRTHGQKEQS